MYIIMSVTMGVGSYFPVLLGHSLLGGWNVLGSAIGGIIN